MKIFLRNYFGLIMVFAIYGCGKKSIDITPVITPTPIIYKLEFKLSSTTYPSKLSLKVTPNDFQKIDWNIDTISTTSEKDTISKVFTSLGKIPITCKIYKDNNVVKTINTEVKITNYEILDSVIVLKYPNISYNFSTENTPYNYKTKACFTVKNVSLLLEDLNQIPNLDKDNIDDIALYHAVQSDSKETDGLGLAVHQSFGTTNWLNLKGCLSLGLNTPIFYDNSNAKKNNPYSPNTYNGRLPYNPLLASFGTLLHEMGHDFNPYFSFGIDNTGKLSLVKDNSVHFDAIIAKNEDVVNYTNWLSKGNLISTFCDCPISPAQGYPFDVMYYRNEYDLSQYNPITLWKMGYVSNEDFDKLKVKYSPTSGLKPPYKLYDITSQMLMAVTSSPTDAQKKRTAKNVLPVILQFEDEYSKDAVLKVKKSLEEIQKEFPNYYKKGTLGKAVAYLRVPFKK